MIDEPQHNLDGSTDAEPLPLAPEPPGEPTQIAGPELLAEPETLPPAPEPPAEPPSRPMGQMFDHAPQTSDHGLPPQDLLPPLPEVPTAEQAPYASPFGQVPPPIGQLPPDAPPGGGTSYGMPHAWPAARSAPLPPPVTQPVHSEFPLRTVLLVAVPLCIIAVIVAILLFNHDADNEAPSAAPSAAGSPVAISPAAAPQAMPAATTFGAGSGGGAMSPTGTSQAGTPSGPTPPAAPVTLTGGAGGGAASANTNSGLAGRWVSKAADYYQFNADGSGSHGTAPNGKSTESFNWTVVDHQINLFPAQQSGDAEPETLPFSFGKDTNSVFLKQADGKFREYALVKNSDAGG